MDLFTRIKEYIYENRQFIAASLLSTLAIVGVIFIVSLFKDSGKNKFSSDDNYYSNYNTTSDNELSSKETSSDDNSLFSSLPHF